MGKKKHADGAELARQALDSPAEHDDIEKRIAELSPEEAALFAQILGLAMRKRRWLLAGYIVALIAVLFGMMLALWMHGTYGRERFIGWAFIIPPAFGGLVLWLVGRHVKRMT